MVKEIQFVFGTESGYMIFLYVGSYIKSEGIYFIILSWQLKISTSYTDKMSFCQLSRALNPSFHPCTLGILNILSLPDKK